jgi:hypothetical protein
MGVRQKFIKLGFATALTLVFLTVVDKNEAFAESEMAFEVKGLDSLEEQREHIYQKAQEKYKLIYDAKLRQWGKGKGSELNFSELFQLSVLQNEHLKNAEKLERALMIASGWEDVSAGEDTSSDTGIMSDPSSLTLTDNLYYNSSTREYNFVGNWNFAGPWDTAVDTIDVAAARMTNSDYQFNRSYAYSYDQAGNKTGEDRDGTHISGSNVTKRYENSYGVVYNVQDQVIETSLPQYLTDNGRISIYFTKPSGAGYTKIFIDFEHNYEIYSWTANASISGTSLSGSSFNVSYSGSNARYKRTSGGEQIY